MVQRLLGLMAVAVLMASCDARSTGFMGVSPPATRLAFLSQPTVVVAGAAISPAVQVAVQNTSGQTVSSSTVPITLTIVTGTGTAGAILTGGASQPASNGLVNFNNLRIDLAGTGYQLLASAAGFQSAASATFNVTP